MIEDVRVAKTANFYPLNRRLSAAAIAKLFRTIRAGHANPTQNHFYESRVASGPARWSAVSFLYERHPAFLRKEADLQERVAGFILLVEHRDHVAIFKSGLEVLVGFATRYLGRVPGDRVDVAVARQDAIFEKILDGTLFSDDALVDGGADSSATCGLSPSWRRSLTRRAKTLPRSKPRSTRTRRSAL